MPQLQQSVMHRLYGEDIWAAFVPKASAELQGWNGTHPSLGRIAADGNPLIVDVGVWKGQSTINMALALKAAGIDGCVVAVDTFLGSVEHWGGHGSFFHRLHGMPDLYETFMSNVVAAGVQDYVVPLAQTSVTAAMVLARSGLSPQLVHIDAAHEYDEVIRDAADYWALLRPGGWLIGDDYHESWPGVVRAAGEFSARTGAPLAIEVPKWIMRKPG